MFLANFSNFFSKVFSLVVGGATYGEAAPDILKKINFCPHLVSYSDQIQNLKYSLNLICAVNSPLFLQTKNGSKSKKYCLPPPPTCLKKPISATAFHHKKITRCTLRVDGVLICLLCTCLPVCRLDHLSWYSFAPKKVKTSFITENLSFRTKFKRS